MKRRLGRRRSTTGSENGPGGEPLARITSGGTTTWIHQDYLGSTRLLTNSAGTKTGDYSYTAYGKTASHTGTNVSLQYNGQYHDAETGFYYLRARYYDPAAAQFIERDPLASSGQLSHSLVDDDPLNSVDPSGLAKSKGKGDRRTASIPEVRAIEKLYGEEIEKVKTGSGRNAGRVDIFVDPDGTIVVAPKGGVGPGEPIATVGEIAPYLSSPVALPPSGPPSTEQYLQQQHTNTGQGVTGSCDILGAVGGIAGAVGRSVSRTSSDLSGQPLWAKLALGVAFGVAIVATGGVAAVLAL